MTSDTSQGEQPKDGVSLLAKLDAINNCLGRTNGAHGHASFIAICQKKLPALLEGWPGEHPCFMEVACSREIIEGQN